MKLSDRELEQLFVDAELPEAGRELVRAIRNGRPDRAANTGANATGRFTSAKMGHTVQVESMRGEGVGCLEYELLPEVLEFWDQPWTFNFQHRAPASTRGVTRATPDFLIIRRVNDGVSFTFEEWRTDRKMRELGKADPDRFVLRADGTWTDVPLETLVRELGLGYRIRTHESVPTTLAENWKLLRDFYTTPYALSPEVTERALETARARVGLTLADLLGSVTGLTADDAFALIAGGLLHANLASALLSQHGSVRIYPEPHLREFVETGPGQRVPGEVVLEPGAFVRWLDRECEILNLNDEIVCLELGGKAKRIEMADFLKMVQDNDIVGLVDPRQNIAQSMLSHTNPKHATIARRRYEVIRPYLEQGGYPASRNQQRFLASYRRAQEMLGDGMLGLYPGFDRQGNYEPRLQEEVEDLASQAIHRYYLNGDKISVRKVHLLYRTMCKEAGVVAMSRQTFGKRLKLLSQAAIARGRQGKKAGFGAAMRTPMGSGTFLAPEGGRAFARVHIDHTVTDVETYDPHTDEDIGRPTLTIARDAYSGRILLTVLLYEAASTRTLQVVLREFVRLYNRLPETIVVDNGPEFHSEYFQDLCARYGVEIDYRRAGKARDGATVESGMKKIDTDLLWTLQGNTKIRKNVRAMSPSKNPSKRAIWTLEDLSTALEQYREWHADQLNPTLGGTPRELFDRSLAATGQRPQRLIAYDTSWRAITALEPRNRPVVSHRGVRINGLDYWCEAFREPGVDTTQVTARYEPFDARIAYVQVNGVWHVATARYRELENVHERDIEAASKTLRRRLTRDPSTEELAVFVRRMKDKEDELTGEKRKARRRRAHQVALLRATDLPPALAAAAFDDPPVQQAIAASAHQTAVLRATDLPPALAAAAFDDPPARQATGASNPQDPASQAPATMTADEPAAEDVAIAQADDDESEGYESLTDEELLALVNEAVQKEEAA